jgi:DNA polymerase I-like protein with 3'-5' exonuclease and polymerase domains
MLISLDTETTGLDVWHGARPFFVTVAREDGTQKFWEWDVNPRNRQVNIPSIHIDEIRAEIDNATEIVGQNLKFDVNVLSTSGIYPKDFPWYKAQDTLVMGHLLASNQPHTLTDLAETYLQYPIAEHEEKLKEACTKARGIVRRQFKTWMIGKAGLPSMPSLKPSSNNKEEKGWAFDMWLPRLLAQRLGYPANHPWFTLLRTYSNLDSAITLPLWIEMKKICLEQGLWPYYETKMKLCPIICEIEEQGLTANKTRLDELKERFVGESTRLGNILKNIAARYAYNLELPKSGVNGSIRTFCFDKDKLNLPVVEYTDSGSPSLDKNAFAAYENRLEPDNLQGVFIKRLADKKGYDTALGFLDSYARFWIRETDVWYRIHSSVNQTGTDTLRMSSSNPNAQQISKLSKSNLRYIFGPREDEEWYSLDAENIELRIPAFEAQEPLLMEVYNNPTSPPYYGSYHLAVFDILHPQLFAQHGKEVKTLFEDTWYQWVKNGNFATIYGAQREKADATYRVPGAFDLLRSKFPNIAKLSDRMKLFAKRHGYVETIPDRSLGMSRGYPMLCSRTDYGDIMPTVPLNYHVSGTACWWMVKAMIRVQEKLLDWRKRDRFNARIVMPIHDELLLAFPKSIIPFEQQIQEEKEGRIVDTDDRNLWRVRVIQKLMEKGGDDIGIKTPVGCEIHMNNWKEGMRF